MILVTGGMGFLGLHTAKALLDTIRQPRTPGMIPLPPRREAVVGGPFPVPTC